MRLEMEASAKSGLAEQDARQRARRRLDASLFLLLRIEQDVIGYSPRANLIKSR